MGALDISTASMMPPPTSPVLASGLKFGFDHSSEAGLVIGGILIALSIVIWSVMVSKLWMLSRTRKANSAFLRAFHSSPHPLALFQTREHHDYSPLYHVYHAASRELAFHLLGTDEPDATFATRLNSAGRITPSQMNAVATAMERAIGEASVKLESKMSAVALLLNGAPFLGVLGTVWGVMDTYSALAGAAEGAAALQTMAPGVCAALLSSVIGLLVAIPGMFGCQLLAERIRALIGRLDHFASEFSSVLGRHFVDHRVIADELPSIGSLGTPNMPAFGGMVPQPQARQARAMAASEP